LFIFQIAFGLYCANLVIATGFCAGIIFSKNLRLYYGKNIPQQNSILFEAYRLFCFSKIAFGLVGVNLIIATWFCAGIIFPKNL